jgi:hypothetical protein
MFRDQSAILRDSTNFVFLDSLKMVLWSRNMQELVLIMNCVLGLVLVFYCILLSAFVG